MTPLTEQAFTEKALTERAFTGSAPFLSTFFLSTFFLSTLFLPTPLAEAAYDASGKRDPFVALLAPDGTVLEPSPSTRSRRAGGGFVLEGIVYDPRGHSMAIIGGEVYEVGDIRGGIEVLAIEPSRVIVLKDGLERTLEVPVSEEGGS